MAESENIVLETNGLTKRFGTHLSNDSISLHVKKGEIYGLVGRNGAGKTTLMKMIVNIYMPTSGEILINGERQTAKHHIPIGALIEEPALMPNLSAFDNIVSKCYLMGVSNPSKHAKELLKMVNLEKTGKKHVAHFSLGMRQRVGIALALVGWPEFVLLDEPVNGLDPQGIQEIRHIVKKVRDEKGITFMISSHLLGELQKVADRFGIISEGKLIKELGDADIDNMGKAEIRLKTTEMDKAKSLLGGLKPRISEGCIFVPYNSDEDLYNVNSILTKASVPVDELMLFTEKGEDIFISLMGGENYV